MAAGVCLGISRRLPLPPTHSPALSKPKKGRICPFLCLLGRGCDDGGEGGSAGMVNRKRCSSARGMNLHFRAPRHPKMSCFLAEIHSDIPFKGTARDLASSLCIPMMLWSETLWYPKLQPLEGGVFNHFCILCNILALAKQLCHSIPPPRLHGDVPKLLQPLSGDTHKREACSTIPISACAGSVTPKFIKPLQNPSAISLLRDK